MADEGAPVQQQPPQTTATPEADLGDPNALRAWAKANKGTEERTKSRLQALQPGPSFGTAEVPFPKVTRDDYLKQVSGAGIFKRALTAPKQRVPLSALTAVQGSINAERLQKHLDDPQLIAKGTKGKHHGLIDMPTVVKINGKHYIHDGHHRATAALVRGERDIYARVVDLDAAMQSGG